MNGEGFDSILSKLLDNTVATMFGATENEYLLGFFLVNNMSQKSSFVALHNEHQ